MHNVKEKLTFIEINPGLGSFGFAAEAADMLRLGPLMLSQDVRDTYLSFHGAGSDSTIADTADIVVANLPFTMFLDGKNADPDVMDVIEIAKGATRKNGIAIFRVKWDIGLRVDMPLAEYVKVVMGEFAKHSVSVFMDDSDGSEPVLTNDLYIIVAPQQTPIAAGLRIEPGAATVIHALKLDDPRLADNDPQLILDALGFPEDFLSVAGTVPDIHERLRECVAIRRAKVVLEFVASNIRG
jgi:hypothetical protein